MVTRSRSIIPSVLVLGLMASAGMVACSAEYSRGPVTSTETVDAGAADSGAVGPGSLDCTATEAELYGDPGDLSKFAVGETIKCKDDGIVTAATMKTTLKAIKNDSVLDGTPVETTYQGRDPVSDTHVYRVLYKTTRAGGVAGFSVASMYLPVTPVSESLPLVLVARGSRGEGPLCAPSKHVDGPIVKADNKDGNYVHDDYTALVFPLAGAGYAVVATDNAGYSPFKFDQAANPVAGYALLDDTARSYLDSSRPLKAALAAKSNDKMVLVGLSQGGHTVLGSLQLANDYAIPGTIVAAAAYSPLWYTQRSWGITLSPLSVQIAGVTLNHSGGVAGAIWYHYSHAEMMDGPGEGLKLFKPALRDAVKAFIENVCWSDTYPALTAAVGVADPSAGDIFSDEMNNALANADLVFGRSCAGSGDLPLCEKWLARYKADHPVHTGKAADTPILLGYGMKDGTIPNDRFACVVEKLKQGRTQAQVDKIEYCVNPEANHGGSVLYESDYVNDWIAAKVNGTAAPAANPTACPQTTWSSAITCSSLTAND